MGGIEQRTREPRQVEDEQFRQWHEAEKVVRDLERKLMIAQALDAGGHSVRSTAPVLRQRLAEARVTASEALRDCLREVSRAKRKPARAGGSSSGGSSSDSN
jgi:hypothetical protein